MDQYYIFYIPVIAILILVTPQSPRAAQRVYRRRVYLPWTATTAGSLTQHSRAPCERNFLTPNF